MTSAEVGVVRRRGGMVGPPYLYDGAQVCGRRTGRTCIFLLASFGAALVMIGLVFFTADLRMESGLWAVGVVALALGVVLMLWFLTLCCAARRSFKALPASHPARAKYNRPALAAPSSSTYQLLPMAQVRTPTPSYPALPHTLPSTASQQEARPARPSSYATPSRHLHPGYTAGRPEGQSAVYTWTHSLGHRKDVEALASHYRGYSPGPGAGASWDTRGSPVPPAAPYTLCRYSPSLQHGSIGAAYSGTLPSAPIGSARYSGTLPTGTAGSTRYSGTLPSAPVGSAKYSGTLPSAPVGSAGYSGTLPSAPVGSARYSGTPYLSPIGSSGYMSDDQPPPYHSVVPGPP